jgi:Gti1/Pac2 family transcription factor
LSISILYNVSLATVDGWHHESVHCPCKMASSTPQIPAASTWTEPPWSGWIETTGDALLILEAARRGLIPRVTRRLVDSERKMITSGSVFVFDEDESGIKRWTDGFFWSPSRILGNFLLYRETDKRGAGHRGTRSDPPPSDINEQSHYNVDGVKLESQTLSRPKGESGQMGIDRHRERTLMGSLTNSYKFKSEGLMKKVCS